MASVFPNTHFWLSLSVATMKVAQKLGFVAVFGIFIITAVSSAPATEGTYNNLAASKQPQAVESPVEDLKARTLSSMSSMSMSMDNIKDMFDWSGITWVPLGQLIFGDKSDGSIGIAKWPIGGSSSNKNSNSSK